MCWLYVSKFFLPSSFYSQFFYPRFPIRVIIREKLAFQPFHEISSSSFSLFEIFFNSPESLKTGKMEKFARKGKIFESHYLMGKFPNLKNFNFLVESFVRDYTRGAIFLSAGSLFERVEPTPKISVRSFSAFSNLQYFCLYKFSLSLRFHFLQVIFR